MRGPFNIVNVIDGVTLSHPVNLLDNPTNNS